MVDCQQEARSGRPCVYHLLLLINWFILDSPCRLDHLLFGHMAMRQLDCPAIHCRTHLDAVALSPCYCRFDPPGLQLPICLGDESLDIGSFGCHVDAVMCFRVLNLFK